MIKVNWKDWRAAKNKRSFIFSSSFNPLRCCSKKSVIQCVPEGMVNPRWRWDGFPSRCGTRCTKWLFKRRQRLSVKGFRSILTCEMHHHRWAVRSNIFPIFILPTTDLSRNCRHAKDVVCTLLIKGVDSDIKNHNMYLLFSLKFQLRSYVLSKQNKSPYETEVGCFDVRWN